MADRFYHPELDRLRFAAFLAVFIYHALPHEAGAFVTLGEHTALVIISCLTTARLGVDLFFCLSSFLITTLLLREHQEQGRIDVRAFWMRRILRIWPLHYFFILLAIFVIPLVLPGNKLEAPYVLPYLLFSGNWACVGNGFPDSVASPLWSVSIEEQFYLFWPVILSIFPVRWLPRFAIACVAAGLCFRYLNASMEIPPPGAWCNTLTRLDAISFGALFAVWIQGKTWCPSAKFKAALIFIGVSLPTLMLYCFGYDDCFEGKWSVPFYPVAALSCVMILAAVYRQQPQLTEPDRSWFAEKLQYLGRISYGLYVFHSLALELCRHYMGTGGGQGFAKQAALLLARFPVALGLTILLAVLSYKFLEMPFLRLKDRFTYVRSSPETPPSQG